MATVLDAAPPAAPPLDGDALYEVIHGERVELPPMSRYATRVGSRLVIELGQFAKQHRLGEVECESLFRIPTPDDPDRNRRPDVAFVSFERCPPDRPRSLTANVWDDVPDLVVEVMSPSDLFNDLIEKLIEYFAAGVRRVWVIHPVRRVAWEYTAFDQHRTLRDGDALDGGDVLPGFRLPLADLFGPPPP